MKALIIHGAGDLRLSDSPAEAMGAGQVRLKIQRGGICGSDLHYYQHGGIGTDIKVREPLILGHEISGEIVAMGEGVVGLNLGDLVAVSPSRPCGVCTYCLKGLANHCLNMRFYGSAMPLPHIQGAFRQELVANAAQCVLASGLSANAAAMAEPLAVCLHAVRQAGNLVGKNVLITGSGPIGLLTALAARRGGAAEIVVTDILGKPLEFALSAGVDHALDLSQLPDALAPYQQGKGSFDTHFECSGAQPALTAGVLATRPGGTVVQLGMSGEMTIPMQQVTTKELTLKGSFRFHEEFALAVEMMQKGLIDVRPLLTHIFHISDFEEAFAVASDKQKSMKVQFDFT